MVDLRLSEEQFLELTPRKFDLLLERHHHAMKLAVGPVALLTCVYMNLHLEKGASMITPHTLYPNLFPEEVEPEGDSPEVLAFKFSQYNDFVNSGVTQ